MARRFKIDPGPRQDQDIANYQEIGEKTYFDM
jgi:hypothetical protein